MADQSIAGASAPTQTTKQPSKFTTFLKRLVTEHPLGTVGALITLVLLLTGIFADSIAPFGMNETAMQYRLALPDERYLLGADELGRDVFTRIIYGARISLVVGLGATILSTAISLMIGMVSGYLGGLVDTVTQRFVDAWMSIPGLIILMVMVTIITPGIFSIILVLGVTTGIEGSRIIRGAVIAIKEDAYVSAATAIGGRTSTILLRHILPNILAPTIVLFSLRVPGAILAEAGLSFLGFGIPPPYPSWGGMLSGDTRWHMYAAPHLVIWPGVALAIVVYGTNMFGDALRDILDPRLRGGAGRFGGGKTKKGMRQRAAQLNGGVAPGSLNGGKLQEPQTSGPAVPRERSPDPPGS